MSDAPDEELIVLGEGDTPEEPAPRKPTAAREGTSQALVKRPTGFDPEVAERILMAVADGKTLREIAAEPDMPTKSTVQRWIMKYPALKTAWQAARELSAASLEEEALGLARDLTENAGSHTGTTVRAFDVAMNQFRWSAAHRDPATFGSSATPSTVVPIQIITSLDIGQGGVKTDVQTNTYEVAAKINEAYNASDAQIEGTDYTLEPGLPREAIAPEGGTDPGADPLAAVRNIDNRRSALQTRRRDKPIGRPKKGWKSPQKIREQITRNERKKKQNG